MAKKKESVYISWDEIDSALKTLGELKIKKAKLEGELTAKINLLKEEYGKYANPLALEIKEIEKEVTRFCEQNKEGFINKRNKKLNFGTVSYRITEKTVIASIPAAIKAIKHLNLDFCLRVKEEIDKDKLKEANLDAGTLAKIGVSVVKEDKLTIEPDMVEIAAGLSAD